MHKKVAHVKCMESSFVVLKILFVRESAWAGP